MNVNLINKINSERVLWRNSKCILAHSVFKMWRTWKEYVKFD